MNLEQARQLINKYVEITQVSPPFMNLPQMEYNKEGFIHEVVINGNVEGLRYQHSAMIRIKDCTVQAHQTRYMHLTAMM